MHYILGTLALLGVGFIGLLIETHKQDKQKISKLEKQLELTEWSHDILKKKNGVLAANQKPVPWNKGKKGYKLNRKPKEETFVLSDATVFAAWDKDGNQTVSPQYQTVSPQYQTVSPQWENLG